MYSKKISINGTCSVSLPCDDTANLKCISSSCLCLETEEFWNSSVCTARPTYNQTCTGSGQCFEERYIYCISGICQCNSTTDANGNQRAFSEELNVCLPCPPKWSSRQSYCYLFNNSNVTFSDAQSECASFNSNLITIDSDAEFEWIKTYVVNTIGNLFHVGGKSSLGKDFRWLYDNTNLSTGHIREVYQGYPYEPCMIAVNIPGVSGLIDDGLCTDLIPFICQKYVTPCLDSQYWNGSTCTNRIARGGSCTMNPQCQAGFVCVNGLCSCAPPVYGQVGGTTLWQPVYSRCIICPYGWTVDTSRCIIQSVDNYTHSNGSTFCTSNGGRLMNIITVDDYNVAKKYDNYWVGALPTTVNDTRVWQWADGTLVNSSLWHSNQPDNYQNNENCSEIRFNGMNDLPCSYFRRALCEKVD